MEEYQTQYFWKMEKKKLTYRDLKAIINSLDESQLDSPVRWGGEGKSGMITDVWIVEEDQINPSGDGWEPVSAYIDDPDFDFTDEPIVCKKNTVILLSE